MAINLLQKQTNKIVDYLAGQGKKIIHDAIQTKDTRQRTQNQNDAYGWAVYYNGREMRRGYWTSAPQANEKRNGWANAGINPGYGREDLVKYLDEYKPKSNGFQLIVVNAVFYTAIQEAGGGRLKHKYRIITQEFSNMAEAGRGVSRTFTVNLL